MFFLQNFFSGLLLGGIYILVAVAFVLIYKSSKILNLAQGSIVLVGAYLSYMLIKQFGISPIPAVILTMALCGIIALGLERFILRPMIAQPILSIVMVTIGIDLLFRGTCNMIWGVGGWRVYPEIFSLEPFEIGPIFFSREHVYPFVLSIVLLILLALFFSRTKQGLLMRAIAQGHKVAQSMGIRVPKLLALSWVIASVLSALAGVFLGSIHNVNIPLADIGLKALAAALLGGLESIGGAVVAGMIIGVVEGLAAGYIGHGVREVAPFVVMMLVLTVRPYGLFGLEEIERV
ncbi:MAG: branched-chain amino acid ABC transporter permease [Thermodesulfobacteriota bacterium]|nr:branched-chain amino acid ABC transporter permease [Thermodesulfobacteriota bacterium]